MSGEHRNELVNADKGDIIITSAPDNTASFEAYRDKRNMASVMLAAMLF